MGNKASTNQKKKQYKRIYLEKPIEDEIRDFYLNNEQPDDLIIKVYRHPIRVSADIYDVSFEEYYFPQFNITIYINDEYPSLFGNNNRSLFNIIFNSAERYSYGPYDNRRNCPRLKQIITCKKNEKINDDIYNFIKICFNKEKIENNILTILKSF